MAHRLVRRVAGSFASVLVITLLTAIFTAVSMRVAPGFFSDERELDPRYGNLVTEQLHAEQSGSRTTAALVLQLASRWAHLDFGRSRSWDVPVSELVAGRVGRSARLLAFALPLSWLAACAFALPHSARAHAPYDLLTTLLSSIALAAPAGALATFCIVAGVGGPVLVLTVLLAARSFRYLQAILRQAWGAQHVAAGRSFGIGNRRLLLRYILPHLAPELIPLLGMSIMTALAALVPVEVLFDQPGLGKLAWQSSQNRDLPVLIAVTLLFSAVVALAGALSNGSPLADSPLPDERL